MTWAFDNRRMLAELLAEHVYLAFAPVLIGLLVAVPLGVLVARSRGMRWPVLGVCAVVQAVPALTFFVLLPALLNTRLADRVNVVVALSLFAVALLTRTVADALRAVPEPLLVAADSMGLSPVGRTTRVELPAAMPAIIAGLRTVTVSCVSLVTVAALVGVGGLGRLFTEGFSIRFETEVLVGAALVLLLAVAADVFLVRVQRAFLPWSKMVPVR